MMRNTVVFMIIFILNWGACGGVSLAELNKQADVREYTEADQDKDLVPLVFNPFNLVGIYIDQRFFQRVEMGDQNQIHDVWYLNTGGKQTWVVSAMETGFDIRYSSNDSKIFDTWLWYIPREKIYSNAGLRREVTTSSGMIQTLFEYVLPSGKRVQRMHVIPSDAAYDDFSGHDQDVKTYGADFLMFTQHIYQGQKSADGAWFALDGTRYPLKSIFGMKFSMESKGALIGGVASGRFSIRAAETTLVQQLPTGVQREYVIQNETSKEIKLHHENAYFTESQLFLKRGVGLECREIVHRLANGKTITLQFDPPLYDLRHQPSSPQSSLFKLILGDTGAEIMGNVRIETDQAAGLKIAMRPDEPKWCAQRPVQVQVSLPENNEITISASIAYEKPEEDDTFDF